MGACPTYCKHRKGSCMLLRRTARLHISNSWNVDRACRILLMNDATPSALDGVTVLEVASRHTRYAGKLFGELGADVILVEPPGGSALRSEGPGINGHPESDSSLSFNYYNTSKRGLTLDLDSVAGQKLFRELVTRADLVLEGEKPGAMEHRNLGYDALRRVTPRLVLTSVTPFGQSGPYARFECEDLVAMALGGFMYLSGYPDSEPIRAYGEQAYLGAGMYAAVASMLALTTAELTGEGDHVDVSMQECVVMAMETAVQYYDLERTVRKRFGAEQRFAGSGVFACKDGYVYMMAAGIGANKFWSYSLAWLMAEGVPGVQRLQGDRWQEIEFVKSDEAKRIFAEVFAPWARQLTKAELYHRGQRHHVPLAPVNGPSDILASPQLAHRGFFIDVPDPRTGSVLRMPGAPYQLSRTPWRFQRPAPAAGQHNAQILGALGRDVQEVQELSRAGII